MCRTSSPWHGAVQASDVAVTRSTRGQHGDGERAFTLKCAVWGTSACPVLQQPAATIRSDNHVLIRNDRDNGFRGRDGYFPAEENWVLVRLLPRCSDSGYGRHSPMERNSTPGRRLYDLASGLTAVQPIRACAHPGM
jgi:hypothetical protein